MDTTQDATAGGGTVILYFPNGAVLKFENATKIDEITFEGENLLLFIVDDNKYTFKKSQLAGWSIPILPR
jgi:hypothetical protein